MSACAPSGTQCPCQTSSSESYSCLCIQRLAIVADLGITYDSATTLQHLMASNASMAVLVGDLTCEANACSLLVLLLNCYGCICLSTPSQPICLPADADNGKFGDHAQNVELSLLLPLLHGPCLSTSYSCSTVFSPCCKCLVMLHGTTAPQPFCRQAATVGCHMAMAQLYHRTSCWRGATALPTNSLFIPP